MRAADMTSESPTSTARPSLCAAPGSEFPPITLPDDPKAALDKIAQYLRTMDTGSDRAVRRDGEIIGYWQCPPWFDGLWDIAKECDRIRLSPNKD